MNAYGVDERKCRFMNADDAYRSQVDDNASHHGHPWSQRFSLSRKRTAKRREREKSLITLDLNLTFMQTSAVKRVKLIISKGTNGNLAITRPLGITNQTNQSYCVFVKISTNPSLPAPEGQILTLVFA